MLGVFFTNDKVLFIKKNFESIEKSVKELLHGWSWRGLTMIGRIQVIKSFAIPKILYRATLIACDKDSIQKLNSILFSFVWKGKDKVKRVALINPIEKGGLSMPDLNSMITTQRVVCIKRYLDPYPAGWKMFLDSYLKNVGGKFLFHCNFDYKKLSITVPYFYKECLISWSSLTENNPSTFEEIVNEVLWNNKNVCIENKSVFSKRLTECGFYKVGDLFDTTGEFVLGGESRRLSISPVDVFLLFSIYNSFPLTWRNILNLNRNLISIHTKQLNPTIFHLYINNEEYNLEKVKSKTLYRILVSKIAKNPTSVKRYEEIYNNDCFQLNWKAIFLLPIQITLSTKLREFQYKILNRIMYTNDMLYKFKKVESPFVLLVQNGF